MSLRQSDDMYKNQIHKCIEFRAKLAEVAKVKPSSLRDNIQSLWNQLENDVVRLLGEIIAVTGVDTYSQRI